MQPDHYELLGLEETATAAEVRAAYRRLARDLHPDLNTATDATARMARLNEAHAVLSDPARRQAYDRGRAASRAAARPVRSAWAPGNFARARARGGVQERPRPARPWTRPEDDGIRDWYAFLGIVPEADSASVLAALARRREKAGADFDMGPDEREWTLASLREARDVLGVPVERDLYDRLRREFEDEHGRIRAAYDNWYAFLGLRPTASSDRIAERVTDLSTRFSPKSRGAAYLKEAWATLRDPERRAAYDAAAFPAPK